MTKSAGVGILQIWYFFLFLLAMFPILYDCCTEVAHHIPRRWLRRNVLMFEIQKGVVQKRRFCLLIFGMSVAYRKCVGRASRKKGCLDCSVPAVVSGGVFLQLDSYFWTSLAQGKSGDTG
uniref:Uncharacterized protein n=1 Tax=Varanus komodoensis TaxID=61221 RepID=A0A8D2ISA1_VARKO